MAHMIVKTEKSRLKESGFILLDLQHIGWGPPTWGGGAICSTQCTDSNVPFMNTLIDKPK